MTAEQQPTRVQDMDTETRFRHLVDSVMFWTDPPRGMSDSQALLMVRNACRTYAGPGAVPVGPISG
jgi:hypothetical protein